MLTLKVSVNKTHLLAIVVVAAIAAVLIPVAAFASHRFVDVDDSNIYHGDITWLADAAVTKGCNPPLNDEFCPTDRVTRQEMAAFMHRLAINQVVDAATAIKAESANTAEHATAADTATTAQSAATADHADTSDTATVAESATDSDAVNGYQASEIVAAYGTNGGIIDDFTGTFTMASIAVDLPSAGLLHIIGTINAADDETTAGGAYLSQELTLDGGIVGKKTWQRFSECVGSVCDEATLTSIVVIEVSAGAQTVGLRATEWDSGSYIFSRSLSILFTPFGAGLSTTEASLNGSPQPGQAGD